MTDADPYLQQQPQADGNIAPQNKNIIIILVVIVSAIFLLIIWSFNQDNSQPVVAKSESNASSQGPKEAIDDTALDPSTPVKIPFENLLLPPETLAIQPDPIPKEQKSETDLSVIVAPSYSSDDQADKREQQIQAIFDDLETQAWRSNTAIDVSKVTTDQAKPAQLSPSTEEATLNSILTQRQQELATAAARSLTQPVADTNQQSRKEKFASTAKTIDYNQHYRQIGLSELEIKAGSVMGAVLITSINTDLPGYLVAQIARPVWSSSGAAVLIPAGAKIVGQYDSRVSFGQRRVLAGWHRIEFPDGSTIDIGNMPAVDRLGQAGLKARVDNKIFQSLAGAAALSVVSAAGQSSQPITGGQLGTRETLAAELGRQFSGVGANLINRILDVQPTLKLRSGYKFQILVTQDIILPAYIN